MISLVIDTNVLVGALLRNGGVARNIMRSCLAGSYCPLIGAALFSEYEDVFGRVELWEKSLLPHDERTEVFNGFLSVCRWIEVFYAWRQNLPDEADNHLIELALAGNAQAIVTRNIRDPAGGELRFPLLQILTPEKCMEVFPSQP